MFVEVAQRIALLALVFIVKAHFFFKQEFFLLNFLIVSHQLVVLPGFLTEGVQRVVCLAELQFEGPPLVFVLDLVSSVVVVFVVDDSGVVLDLDEHVVLFIGHSLHFFP